MTELKPCPFCGGKAKIHYRQYKFFGQNDFGNKKLKYIVQVFCNKCNSRGEPITTDWLIDPSPYHASPDFPEGHYLRKQWEIFEPYIKRATNAWNIRAFERENNLACADEIPRFADETLKAFTCCTALPPKCEECPLFTGQRFELANEYVRMEKCKGELKFNVKHWLGKLMSEEQPISPVYDICKGAYHCGKCNSCLIIVESKEDRERLGIHYCPHCGHEVKWE